MKRKIKERCTYYEDVPDVWLHEEPNISIILPAKFIPDGSVVTKKTGNKEFILKSSIFIIPYSEENGEFVKKEAVEVTTDGTFFLVDNNSKISPYESISQDKLLQWKLNDEYEIEKFTNIIKMREYGIPQ